MIHSLAEGGQPWLRNENSSGFGLSEAGTSNAVSRPCHVVNLTEKGFQLRMEESFAPGEILKSHEQEESRDESRPSPSNNQIGSESQVIW